MYLLHIPDKWMPFAKCKHFQKKKKKEYFSYGTHTFKHLNKKANIFKESMTNRGSYTAQGIKARDTILQLQTVLGLSLLTFSEANYQPETESCISCLSIGSLPPPDP